MKRNSCKAMLVAESHVRGTHYILTESTWENTICAVALVGGSYFRNGIAFNVIEAAEDPAQESWLNINRIDDVVHVRRANVEL